MKRALLVLALLVPAAPAQAAKVYFTSGEQFRIVTRDTATAKATLQALLRGPTADERKRNIDSQIPAGTKLRRLFVSVKHHARVELNGRFTRGAKSAELRARVGQIVYTATGFKGIRTVTVLADGDDVSGTLSRADYGRP